MGKTFKDGKYNDKWTKNARQQEIDEEREEKMLRNLREGSFRDDDEDEQLDRRQRHEL